MTRSRAVQITRDCFLPSLGSGHFRGGQPMTIQGWDEGGDIRDTSS